MYNRFLQVTIDRSQAHAAAYQMRYKREVKAYATCIYSLSDPVLSPIYIRPAFNREGTNDDPGWTRMLGPSDAIHNTFIELLPGCMMAVW